MKILIAAPDITPPWSEGRKNFVRDLVPPLSRGRDIRVLSTFHGEIAPRGKEPIGIEYVKSFKRYTQLSSLHKRLKEILSSGDRPDILLHFPFATFTGLRGLANERSMVRISRLAGAAHIPCLTVLYSLTRGNLTALSRKIGMLAAGAGKDWAGPVVDIGINLKDIVPVWQKKNTGRLLFMAGLPGKERSRLKNVLYTRGLIDILKIGEPLARQGFTLTVALPLLRHPERKRELEGLVKKMCPSLKVRMETLIDVGSFFKDHGIYLFPFRESQTRFTPTSILEAAASGMPVIISDLPMLSSIFDLNPPYIKPFRARHSEELLRRILELTDNWDETVQKAGLGMDHVRRAFDIHNSARQIMDIMGKMRQKNKGDFPHPGREISLR